MKLIMPKTVPNQDMVTTTLFSESLRNSVRQTASRLDVAVEELDPGVFMKYAFIAEGYAIALSYARYVDDVTEAKRYLEGCCQVFREEITEMEMVDRGLPEFVKVGYDKLLQSIADEIGRRGLTVVHSATLH
ncbi:hypothetical protein AA316_002660 [Salmonella enterica subsp. enterica]|nr:hypothetical protein [Salmonella enterica]EBR8168502.1 hypothetical protein [Salmonella enterica subsp. enterica serovar Virchow]ECP8365292.1 hypothetical protein [Salmonella enterica subsp. enterica serovar Muenchen]ECV8079048.1 hypothetical protein [Salmonella enterica subsp. enterica serovar Infantis]EED5579498.1 hypothetical protein [Salmonella enterica subsp. enterica serovar Agona]EEJ3663037.1 hypothetical protein [Salmonella enterica subsp. enterica]EIG6229998.1 hypothetical protein